ncbi:MAG: metallophosphoesterase [Deltaproteobacteria bacterium]|nr:metallophosphoesterase [Deltaproteobacteria bacterium]
MPTWFFTSDLHGSEGRVRALVAAIRAERPEAVLIGGDLLPNRSPRGGDFLEDVLVESLLDLKRDLGQAAPAVLVILGNDDPASVEPAIRDAETRGAWTWVEGRRAFVGGRPVYGCGLVPPTPFLLKDRERYDVSRFLDPGAVSPEEGWRSVPVTPEEARRTLGEALDALVGDDDLSEAVLLLHSPPYGTALDRAGLDDRWVDHVPLDVHVGSIAVRRLVEARHPRLVLCGHVHEAARLTGTWREQIGSTHVLQGAHDGPELSLVRVDPANPASATRDLIDTA